MKDEVTHDRRSGQQTASQRSRAGRPFRKWLGRLGLITFLLILAGVIGCLWLYFSVFGARKSSQPYKIALERVRQDQQVIQRLGQPVEDFGLFPTGNVHTEGDRGNANLHFSIRGPQGKANVSVQARQLQGEWGLTMLDVRFSDGERFTLDPVDAGLEDAPVWPPPQQ